MRPLDRTRQEETRHDCICAQMHIVSFITFQQVEIILSKTMRDQFIFYFSKQLNKKQPQNTPLEQLGQGF